MQTISEKIQHLTEASVSLGKVGVLIIENGNDFQPKIDEAKVVLSELQYQNCADYLEIMDALSSGQKKIYYIEEKERLDGLVLEIVAEFEAGIVSLADRKNQSGLKTAQWNSAEVSFVVVMSRAQIENSHPKLFEYINIMQSI